MGVYSLFMFITETVPVAKWFIYFGVYSLFMFIWFGVLKKKSLCVQLNSDVQ